MNSYLDQCLSDENEMFNGIKFSYNYDIEYLYCVFVIYIVYFLIQSDLNFSFVAINIFVLSFAFFEIYPVQFIATTSQNCKDSKSATKETDSNDFFSSIIFPLRCTSILYEEKTQYWLVVSTGKYMTIKLMPVKSTICKTFDKPKFTHEKYL